MHYLPFGARLPKVVITKLKFLKEMHTVTKISEDSETASYIFFLINNKIKNKQPPNCNCLHSISHFNSLPQLLTKSLFSIYSYFACLSSPALTSPINKG